MIQRASNSTASSVSSSTSSQQQMPSARCRLLAAQPGYLVKQCHRAAWLQSQRCLGVLCGKGRQLAWVGGADGAVLTLHNNSGQRSTQN
jgi:hypothetical protein